MAPRSPQAACEWTRQQGRTGRPCSRGNKPSKMKTHRRMLIEYRKPRHVIIRGERPSSVLLGPPKPDETQNKLFDSAHGDGGGDGDGDVGDRLPPKRLRLPWPKLRPPRARRCPECLRCSTPLDIYAADRPGKLSPVVAKFPSLVYVPNSGSNTVDIIDPKTFKVIRHFDVGRQPAARGAVL